MKNKLIYFGLCLLLVSCNNTTSTPNNNKTSNSSSNISLINGTIEGPNSIGVGDLVIYRFNSLASSNVVWESSDPLTIEINSRGEAIAFKEGVVTIYAKDNLGNVLNSLEVKVENKVSLPQNELDIYNLFTKAIELEIEGSSYFIEKKNSSINQTYTRKAKLYDDFYVVEVEDVYENHTGAHHEIATEYRGIKGDYYYDVSDSNEISYGIKRKIVKSNPTDYEILETEAKKRTVGPNFISYFYSYLADIWGARTLDLQIEVEELDDSFKLVLSNTYLFVWADGVSNDSRNYEATLEFANDGFFLSAYYKETTYEENQYDVANKKWKDNPLVKETSEYTFSAIRGERHNPTENTFVPEDYFVKQVTKATYNNKLVVGSHINLDYISLVEYEGEKAVDIENILIKEIQNDGNNVVVVEDTTNGGYITVSAGTAYLVCQMMYSPDVIFLVEIEVLEA